MIISKFVYQFKTWAVVCSLIWKFIQISFWGKIVPVCICPFVYIVDSVWCEKRLKIVTYYVVHTSQWMAAYGGGGGGGCAATLEREPTSFCNITVCLYFEGLHSQLRSVRGVAS